MRASVQGMLLLVLCLGSTAVPAAEAPEADKIIEQIDRLKDDELCLMINGFVVREKSLFMAGLIAAKELDEPGRKAEQVLSPLIDDANLLTFDAKLTRDKLRSWGINLEIVDQDVSAVVQRDADRNLTMWTDAIGMQGAGTYLNLIAGKQRYCKNHLTKIGRKT